jgi:hypothetical protein
LDGDLPPWDTWVAYLIARRDVIRASWNKPPPFRLDVLVCWVPQMFAELVDQGLDASEVPLGEWVSESRPLRDLHADLLRSLGG